MKRSINLYNKILNFENAQYVYKNIKRNMKNKKEIIKFNKFLNQNILDILIKLNKESYEFGKYRIFLIKEPKYRIIMSENINDKLVNHLVSRFILIPGLEKSLIDSNVATRKNKGNTHGFNTLVKYLNKVKHNKKVYALKIDIKKYFYNIDHNILIDMIKNKIKDKKSLNIIKKIIFTTNYSYINEEIENIKNNEINNINNLDIEKNLKTELTNQIISIPKYEKNKGLPIGNMSSQILAIYYLNEVDHFIKEHLNHKYYIRYMDDLVIIDTDKTRLKSNLIKIVNKIKENKLETNNKTKIYDLNTGFNFLGYKYVIKNNSLFIKTNKKTNKRIKNRLKYLKSNDLSKYNLSLSSYKGYFLKVSKCYEKNY